jgi:hypothetical protein
MRISFEGSPLVGPETAAEPPLARAPPSEPASPSAFERLVGGLGTVIDRGDTLVERAATASYAHLDAAQLIALQAGIYRYGEAVDLTAKLVDRLTGAAKTVLEGGR